MEDSLGPEGLRRSVVVVATSDRPALERSRVAYVGTAIAEYFRDQGLRVMLMMDSVTRFARALRDVGLAMGEPPTRRGFTPSVFSALPRLFERAGNNDRGTITAFYTVLIEEEEGGDPVGEEVRSILDGHIHLSKKLAAANHYPAIDILSSASRVMPRVTSPEHQQAAGLLRRYLSKYREIELLLQLGEFRAGNDPEADVAVAKIGDINAFPAPAVREPHQRLRRRRRAPDRDVQMKRFPLEPLTRVRDLRLEAVQKRVTECRAEVARMEHKRDAAKQARSDVGDRRRAHQLACQNAVDDPHKLAPDWLERAERHRQWLDVEIVKSDAAVAAAERKSRRRRRSCRKKSPSCAGRRPRSMRWRISAATGRASSKPMKSVARSRTGKNCTARPRMR